MATVVKNTNEIAAAPQSPPKLLRASLIGAVYVALCLGVVFFGVPWLWKSTVGGWVGQHIGKFFDPAGMALLLLAAAIGLLYLGKMLADLMGSPAGLRAGVFVFVAGG